MSRHKWPGGLVLSEREVDPPSNLNLNPKRKQHALAPAQPSDGPADGNWVTVFGFPQGYLHPEIPETVNPRP